MTTGTFGDYGGQYVPEALMGAVEELEAAYERYVLENADGFMDEFRAELREFGGRPTPLQYAPALSDRYEAKVYLKREDLLHGGAHKLNNALGQVLLAKYMGKERIIAETGAGQHGTATALAAAHVGLDCEIYMGRTDVNRQRPNVFRMALHDAQVNPVEAGSATLKEAINETLRDWATNVENTHYVIGSVVGPHPFPRLVRDFQAVISEESRAQINERIGDVPDAVIACAGGGSNTMGSFHHFVDDEGVDLVAVEAGGSGLDRGQSTATGNTTGSATGSVTEDATGAGSVAHSASLSVGEDGVLHGAKTKLLQDPHGQILESHSVSAGLDYSGVGPELSHLVASGRVTPATVSDDDALRAFHRLSKLEGIIPALESSHALAYLERAHSGGETDLGETVLVTVSGRGDKDLDTVIEESARRGIETAPALEVFE